MSKFEISENPTIENTTALEANAPKVSKPEQGIIKGKTKMLKIKVNGQPYYHFSSVEFNSEIATRNSNVVVGGKRFYEGIIDKRMVSRLNLATI
jgi:hypothetical protein